jgi:universal stress protein E
MRPEETPAGTWPRLARVERRMQLLRAIVVGVDFSPGCRGALGQALRIGGATGASVRAVHVIDSLIVADLQEALGSNSVNLPQDLVEEANRHWTSFSATVEGAAATQFTAQIGNRAAALMQQVQDLGAGVLVLGAVANPGADSGPGAVASACVRRSPCDVLLVRAGIAAPWRRVVVAVDFSPTSRLALERGAEMALQDRAELRVVHVFSAPWKKLHYRAPTPEAAPHFQSQYRRVLQDHLGAFVQGAGDRVAAARPTVELLEHDGHRSGIVEYAAHVSADLVVLGTRGRTNLRDVLLGSTAEKVLQEARCSLLAVRPAGG